MSGLNWLRTIATFCATGTVSFFILKHFLSGTLSFVIAIVLALLSLFASSLLFRQVLRESVRYPGVTSELGESEPSKSDWKINKRG